MSWNDEKVTKLKELWGKGSTASQIAEIIGGLSRNAVIGKAHRLNLSSKSKSMISNSSKGLKNNLEENDYKPRHDKKSKYKSLIIEKDFEPENPIPLEKLTDKVCRWPVGHPDEKDFYFCGRSSMESRVYCKLHVMHAYQPKGWKEDKSNNSQNEELPDFIEKKIKTA